MSQYDFLFKLVLVGDSGVGKSNILSRYTIDDFLFNSKSTVGVEYGSKTLNVKGKTVKVQIWDTAGQERFRSITNAYYHGATGALVVYDISNVMSFKNVERWVKEVQSFADPNIVIAVVGNKCDMQQLRSVNKESALSFAEEKGFFFIETSALDSTGISALFEGVTERSAASRRVISRATAGIFEKTVAAGPKAPEAAPPVTVLPRSTALSPAHPEGRSKCCN